MPLRRFIWSLCLFALVALGACTPQTLELVTLEARAASTTVLLEGAKPWAFDAVALPSTTEYTLYRAPTWVRSLAVKNLDPADPLYIGNYDETGLFVGAPTDDLTVLAAGEAHSFYLADCTTAVPDAAHFLIPLASSTASHVASFSLSGACQ